MIRVAALVAAATLVLPGASGAAVEGTHHDMRLYGLFGDQGVCAYCHVPHGAQAEVGLFARAGTGEGLGPIGSFCYSCHDGTVVPTALVEAPDGSMGLEALTRSHGFEIARLGVLTGGLETAASVYASGLVRVADPANPPQRLDCNSCHDPHADQNPPFLKAPLADLCQKCHSGQGGAGRGRWTAVEDRGLSNWAHPVGMPVRESGLDRVRGKPWEMSFHGPDRFYDVPTPSREDLRRADVHWETGGHLLGAERQVGCPTCHSAHMPRPGLLASAGAASGEVMLCTGCHTDGLNRENPGATPYYHPVFESSLPPYVHDHASHGVVVDNPNIPSTGTMDLFVTLPKDWPLGGRSQLLCQTCHRAHRGVAGARVLRRGPQNALVACNECHGMGEQTAAVNRHHPTGNKNYTDPAVAGFPLELGWRRGVGLPGDLTDGLQCVDCHVELAKSAHNW
ncbi:MAG: cytochrome c3 family protein [Thermodesulfobacteriota bacterium]